jgi:hypothetical protein
MEELRGLDVARPRGRARLLQLMERLARGATSAEQVAEVGRVGWVKVAHQQHLLTSPNLAPSTARVLALLAGEGSRRSGVLERAQPCSTHCQASVPVPPLLPAERCVQLSPGPAAGEGDAAALQKMVPVICILMPTALVDSARRDSPHPVGGAARRSEPHCLLAPARGTSRCAETPR